MSLPTEGKLVRRWQLVFMYPDCTSLRGNWKKNVALEKYSSFLIEESLTLIYRFLASEITTWNIRLSDCFAVTTIM